MLTLVITYCCWFFFLIKEFVFAANKQHSLGSQSQMNREIHRQTLSSRHTTFRIFVKHTYCSLCSGHFFARWFRPTTTTTTKKEKNLSLFSGNKSKTCLVILCSSNFAFNVINKFPPLNRFHSVIVCFGQQQQRSPCFAIIYAYIQIGVYVFGLVHILYRSKKRCDWQNKIK